MRKFEKIHKPKVAILFILISLIASNACSKASKETEISNQADKMRERQKNREAERNRAPIELTAKTIENFPAPSDAETVPENPDDKKPAWTKKVVNLKSKAAVYDTAHFYQREMTNGGWKDEKPDEIKSLDARSILSYLTFSNADEEVDVNISSDGKGGSEIRIEVSESRQSRRNSRTAQIRRSPVPMPACADGSNLISDDTGTTVSAVCVESLESVAKYYTEALPEEAWQLKSKTGNPASDETVTMIFTKENQRAVITLVRDGKNSTSVNVRVSK